MTTENTDAGVRILTKTIRKLTAQLRSASRRRWRRWKAPAPAVARVHAARRNLRGEA